jgi:nucleoside-diphosphate-sugar epimerase
VYGPNPRKDMFFDKLLNGTLEYVTTHERDFIHVDDVCNAILLLIKSTFTGPIDIGTGISIKVKSIKPDLPITNGFVGERQHTCADTTKLKSLGFTPRHTVESFLSTNSN